jgi:hypothetical protein
MVRANFDGLTLEELQVLTPFDIAVFVKQIELALGNNLETILNQEEN